MVSPPPRPFIQHSLHALIQRPLSIPWNPLLFLVPYPGLPFCPDPNQFLDPLF